MLSELRKTEKIKGMENKILQLADDSAGAMEIFRNPKVALSFFTNDRKLFLVIIMTFPEKKSGNSD